jgi:hypothetical protein
LKRCTTTKDRITQHRPGRGETLDVSPTVAKACRKGLHPPDHTALCKCGAGECAFEDCAELGIFDAAGNHIASYFGRQYRATYEEPTQTSQGGLTVYAIPNAQKNTRDANVRAMSEINRRNAEFWKVAE